MSFINSSFFLPKRRSAARRARAPSTVEVSCWNQEGIVRFLHLVGFQQFVSVSYSRVQSLLYDHGLGQVPHGMMDQPDGGDVKNAPSSMIPPVPDESIERGVLPRVIETLVDRRRAVCNSRFFAQPTQFLLTRSKMKSIAISRLSSSRLMAVQKKKHAKNDELVYSKEMKRTLTSIIWKCCGVRNF
jgi:hypothetical protein